MAHLTVYNVVLYNASLYSGGVPNGQWSVKEVADFLDVQEVTVRAYSTRGQMPEPDGRLGNTPWWKPETIIRWNDERTDAARSKQ